MIFQQEYTNRKKQRIHSKIAKQMTSQIEEAKHKDDVDLSEMLSNMSQLNTVNNKTKGSRFTHTEKLQFRQVSIVYIETDYCEVINPTSLVGCLKNRMHFNSIKKTF